jgi:hypothetical protein
MGAPLQTAQAVESPANPMKGGQLFVWLKGYSVFSTLAWLYDYPLYTYVIWKAGPLWGGITLTVLSVVLDIATLRFYDWSQEDWLALEYLKSIREYQGKSRPKRALRWILRTPTPIQVVILSLRLHPPVVALLLRKGAYQYGRMSSRDWTIFWASSVVGNMYWLALIAAGVTSVEHFLG